MKQHPIEELINKADQGIGREDFDTLIDIYADDAVLVIRPGMNAFGKPQIRKAVEAIAEHFDHSLKVEQAGMEILEAADTASVLGRHLRRNQRIWRVGAAPVSGCRERTNWHARL